MRMHGTEAFLMACERELIDIDIDKSINMNKSKCIRFGPRFAAPCEELVFSERELMFMFAICRRPFVCLSSIVCNVRAPYSGD